MKIGKLKVIQIRKELQDRGLDMTGTRPALMKRLREALQREQQDQPQQQQQQRKEDDPTLPKPTTPPPRPSNNSAEQHQSSTPPLQPNDETPNAPPPSSSPPFSTAVPGQQESIPVNNQPQDPPTPGQTNMDYRHEEQQREDDFSGTKKDNVDQVDVTQDEDRQVVANGDLQRLNELAHEERMRKRMQRFGAVEKPKPKPTPQPTEKPLPETTKSVKSTDADELNKVNELKRRRAIKFGSALVDSRLSKEERERRLKRQRRFQTAGSGTAV